jgi:hypothetical protein
MMTRRDLLLARGTRPRIADLSGERLYMRYVDSRVDGTTAALFESLAVQLKGVDEVHVSEPAWLADRELKAHLDPLFAALRASGIRVRILH